MRNTIFFIASMVVGVTLFFSSTSCSSDIFASSARGKNTVHQRGRKEPYELSWKRLEKQTGLLGMNTRIKRKMEEVPEVSEPEDVSEISEEIFIESESNFGMEIYSNHSSANEECDEPVYDDGEIEKKRDKIVNRKPKKNYGKTRRCPHATYIDESGEEQDCVLALSSKQIHICSSSPDKVSQGLSKSFCSATMKNVQIMADSCDAEEIKLIFCRPNAKKNKMIEAVVRRALFEEYLNGRKYFLLEKVSIENPNYEGCLCYEIFKDSSDIAEGIKLTEKINPRFKDQGVEIMLSNGLNFSGEMKVGRANMIEFHFYRDGTVYSKVIFKRVISIRRDGAHYTIEFNSNETYKNKKSSVKKVIVGIEYLENILSKEGFCLKPRVEVGINDVHEYGGYVIKEMDAEQKALLRCGEYKCPATLFKDNEEISVVLRLGVNSNIISIRHIHNADYLGSASIRNIDVKDLDDRRYMLTFNTKKSKKGKSSVHVVCVEKNTLNEYLKENEWSIQPSNKDLESYKIISPKQFVYQRDSNSSRVL